MGKKFTQANRPLAVKVEGLDPDTLLLTGFSGDEAISQLFNYRLDLLVENPARIPFETILGKSVTVELGLGGAGRGSRELKRFFNGICRRVAQGERDATFTRFRMEVVPQAWLLTKVARSRVFQHQSVWEILAELLKGLKADLQNYGPAQREKRDYCVQYRETDFNFASRLMAEEGLHFYFKHGDGSHLMIVNGGTDHDDLTAPAVHYSKTGTDPDSIRTWEKVQELRAGKVSFRDHTFEQPRATLDVTRPVLPEIVVGRVTHKLNGVNANLELYDYPGQYAKRFDGIDKGGAEQPGEVAKIFPEEERTARIRIE